VLNAEERCPDFSISTQRLYWPFEDPAAFQGTADEAAAKFREVRDLIDERIRAWLRRAGDSAIRTARPHRRFDPLAHSMHTRIAARARGRGLNSIGNWRPFRWI